METFLDVYVSPDGEKASGIFQKLLAFGFKPTIGDHDFVYYWKRLVNLDEEIDFVDNIQAALKGSGALLRFVTIR